MPRYEVRLEAQDGSGHFRSTRLEAETPEAAQRLCERRELELVLYEPTAEQIRDLFERNDIALPTAADKKAGHTDAELNAALAQLSKPAPADADPADKRAFLDTFKGGDRALIQGFHHEQPYKVVSVTEWSPDGEAAAAAKSSSEA